MTISKIKSGMIGVGGFGAARRSRIRESGLFDLDVVCDLNPDALRKACEEENARAVDSYDELLTDDTLEAVFISTGASAHASQILAALEAGKHVFVEKPFVSHPGELQEVFDACTATALVVGVGHAVHEQDWRSTLAKQYLDSGKLGKLTAVEFNSSHSGGLTINPGDWRSKPENNPGGMLFQCGVHSLHFAMSLLGPIDRVAAFFRDDVHSTQTVDAACCLLHFKSGLIGTLNCFHVTAYEHMNRFFGTKGNLHLDHIRKEGFFQPRKLNDYEEHIPVPTFEGETADPGVRNFYNAIRKGTPMRTGWQEGARAVQVVFAAEESARLGKTIEVPSLCSSEVAVSC